MLLCRRKLGQQISLCCNACSQGGCTEWIHKSERVTKVNIFKSAGGKKSKHKTSEQLAKVPSQLAKQSVMHNQHGRQWKGTLTSNQAELLGYKSSGGSLHYSISQKTDLFIIVSAI